ncbi:hypothetical protein AB0L88_42430 [Saccharopolyspora shandongensis]|uniref:hypothetical protein n=1 Tax=Saccharopolyspora shandongensis TaxID=418495 RepID=UPI003431EBA3
MHSAVVAERDQVATARGERERSGDPAGAEGRGGADHRDPAFGVAGRDDRDVAVQHGERGIGRGGGIDRGDRRPSRVFAEHDQPPGRGLAERRERLAAARDGNGSGRAVRFRRRDESAAGAVEPPVQQPGSRGGEDVHLPGSGRQHRNGVDDPDATEVRPARLIGEPRAHAAARVADRDQRPAVRCHDGSRWPGRRRAEVLPAVLPAAKQDLAGAVLDHERVRIREPHRPLTRDETRCVHNGLP